MLQDLLTLNIFHFLLVFSRLSPIFLLFPGISAAYVPVQLRLIIAVMVALVALPMVQGQLPAQPGNAADLVWLIVEEFMIGGFLGALVQAIMGALQLTGEVVSQTSGLSNVLVDDPVTQEQSAIILGLLDIIAVLLIFVTDAHLLLLTAAVDSYNFMRAGQPLFFGDMLSMTSTLVNQSFSMGIRLAAPFLVFQIVFQTTSGILARLSPQLNVYFVAMPAQIALGLTILMITLPTIMLVFLHFFDDSLHALLGPVTG